MSPHPLVPALRGEQVILARLRREDIPALAGYFQNLELSTYLGGSGVAYSLEDEQASFEGVSRSRPDGVSFGIYEASTERLIGGTDLRDINHRQGTAELGVSLHDPDCWARLLGPTAGAAAWAARPPT
ncbi:GNAT family N-acetyltransferase [Deinococcus koreensis]|uniref:GNAT family N-acetyltransferase n=1 Tax=Deinococcus koreensis TaxID=2054903 RepID=UPI002434F0CC|nr:GNAT family N-acetyltransferase [Deinococcus koreensis]